MLALMGLALSLVGFPALTSLRRRWHLLLRAMQLMLVSQRRMAFGLSSWSSKVIASLDVLPRTGAASRTN